jgi:Na+-translocating ferredoxin:NAD+ oxidoreductase RnfG subunit
VVTPAGYSWRETVKRRTFITQLIASVGTAALADRAATVFAQNRFYLTEEQALRLIFPKSDKVLKETQVLSDEQLQVVEKGLRLRLSCRTVTVFRGESSGKTDGYAMIANEIGKDQFITFIVGIRPDLKVQRVALMVFRESRGWEVDDPRFTDQFHGKSAKDRLLVSSDIEGVTGATLSSRAFCRGTKKALLICEALYKK